nr:helix-turn-helix transcriptional regulator [Propionivibrio soli]
MILKGFRKENGLTQAAMGERLGITQQSYAAFEANPAVATFERLYKVLRLVGVEISLDRVSSPTNREATLPASETGKARAAPTASSPKKATAAIATLPKRPKTGSSAQAPRRVVSAAKKEKW